MSKYFKAALILGRRICVTFGHEILFKYWQIQYFSIHTLCLRKSTIRWLFQLSIASSSDSIPYFRERTNENACSVNIHRMRYFFCVQKSNATMLFEFVQTVEKVVGRVLQRTHAHNIHVRFDRKCFCEQMAMALKHTINFRSLVICCHCLSV